VKPGIVYQVSIEQRAAWRRMAEWRVRASIAVRILERAIESPDDFICTSADVELFRSRERAQRYADSVRKSWVQSCRDEIDRLQRAMSDNKLLASIYGRGQKEKRCATLNASPERRK